MYLNSEHFKPEDYIILPARIIEDARISADAKALLAFMLWKLKRDQHYRPIYTELQGQFPRLQNGRLKPAHRHTVQKWMNALVRAGYVERERTIYNGPLVLHTGERLPKTSRGGTIVWTWRIYSIPRPEAEAAQQAVSMLKYERRQRKAAGNVTDYRAELWNGKA